MEGLCTLYAAASLVQLIIIMLKVFVKRKILFIQTILGQRTHTGCLAPSPPPPPFVCVCVCVLFFVCFFCPLFFLLLFFWGGGGGSVLVFLFKGNGGNGEVDGDVTDFGTP